MAWALLPARQVLFRGDPDATMMLVKRLDAVRERTEDLERASLSTWATLASETKGRDRHEEADRLRTAFQVDRDRILHTSAFRRLKDKTQTFIAAEGGHYRVRLTHTLEVAQVAGTIARALRLNEDLVEAIALGHDIGHTPFGHAGEEALSAFTETPFRHSEQSVRVVERLERGGRGLNLTWEVRDGILNHPWSMPEPATPEGQVVRQANRIASLNHDLDDAFRAGILAPRDVPADVTGILGPTHSRRIATMVGDVVATSLDQPEVRMSGLVHDAHLRLRDFVFRHVYLRPAAAAERDRAVHTLRSLAVFYLENPGELPAAAHADEPRDRRVVDFVSAMTDRDALATFRRLFLPC
ncbi:MAG TPA: deoxyguanosinetriphosphate triphosphohydrolase [Egibacteraceae bacterium]|nr:deoxyguanosinetriphosphate triphosphohydrolase [Egibacteraceae bacterium]